MFSKKLDSQCLSNLIEATATATSACCDNYRCFGSYRAENVTTIAKLRSSFALAADALIPREREREREKEREREGE
jgi:hypothetical protein